MKSWLIFLTPAVVSLAGPIYSVDDLGGLGGASATAFSINSSGIAVGWADTLLGTTQALVAGNGALQMLGPGSQAYGVNNAGQVVGVQGSHGALWTSAGMIDLGDNVAAIAINNSGQIAGGNGHALLLSGNSMQDLGTLGGGNWSAAYGLNDAGEVVGSAMLAGGSFRGFAWTAQTGMVALGTLGGKDSHAMSVNAAGEVAGAASLSTGYQHAVLYSDGQTIDLGSLGGPNSYGYSINAAGTVVGYSDVAGGAESHAFIYSGGVMVDLNSLISSASGWELLAAYGINDAGQIVGSGLYQGQSAMFLLNTVPPPPGLAAPSTEFSVINTPEPATVLLLAVGLAAALVTCSRGRLVRPIRKVRTP